MLKLVQASREYNPSQGPQVRPSIELELLFSHQTCAPYLCQGLDGLIPDKMVIEKGGRGMTSHPTLEQVKIGVPAEAGLGKKRSLCGVDVAHFFSANGDVTWLRELHTLIANQNIIW